MENHVGVVAIIVKNRKEGAPEVNKILTEHGDIVIGRMGLPYKQRDIYVVTLIVDGTNDEIGSLTGQLGAIKGVTVKSTLTKCGC